MSDKLLKSCGDENHRRLEDNHKTIVVLLWGSCPYVMREFLATTRQCERGGLSHLVQGNRSLMHVNMQAASELQVVLL